MKQLLLGLLLSLFASAAYAACPTSLQLQDANSVKAPARYFDDGSGNCMPGVVVAPGWGVNLNTGTSTIGNVGINAGTNAIGFVSNDPCAQAVKSNIAIAAQTETVQIVAGSASKKIYMCSLSLISNAVQQISVIEGTGTLCATANEAAVIGSTVPTLGMAFTTNGGVTLGSGGGTIGVTATAANGLCILQSLTTSVVSGNLTYVQQ